MTQRVSSGNRGLKEAFSGVQRFLKSRGCNTEQQMADALKVAQPQINIWSNGRPPKNWSKLSNRIFDYGAFSLMKQLIPTVMRACGIETQAELAKALGVSSGTVWNWMNGKSMPQPAKLRRLLELDTERLVKTIFEFERIAPSGRRLYQDDKTKEKKFAEKLWGKRGLYIFYDSAGRVVYVGKSAMGKRHDLLREVKQQLSNQTKRPFLQPSKGHSTKKVVPSVGEMAHYLSAYEVRNPKAIHRLESLLLRTFPNDHGNKNLGRL